MRANTLSIDYTGAHGGELAMAFGAGWAACAALCAALGAFMWKILGKAKDEQIASLIKTIEKNEERCAETIDALSNRVQQLETLLLIHSSGPLRQDLQKAISEQRVETLDESGES
ncbi:hypothetical protein [Sphingobium xenophagum]|uniref:hypothetical protein n=1 Tax=Sphingobium xenophagum TaxID=121428 RepID=UPI0012FD4B0E|nr:hypothetical protein [Sphingobium xenophagum]